MEIANVIVSGVRIYLPPDNILPRPSTDMLTFAVVKDPGLISDYILMVHKNGRWELATPNFYKETEQAIMAAVKIGEKVWQ
ncbi:MULTISPECIES: hypothetical protein [Klebsiella/Raoultella group]|nr:MULTISPECIES: hypothetical protein [Klebsiella/Raoultella group]AUW00328.1 hypothetical protein C2U46_23035 [Klebsiella oxytoca]DAZ17278.1 MAG TPA: hypothetical protein [Caudoviricetes sp.]AOV11747.1 hypothetical protein BJF97_12175 [Klebsiella sp. LTGPAF-6F]AOV13555.1 hypothetical protein BJF97_22005 [Klebsiella sp. LTGPAF-6F]KAB8152861.1 hypothetical protein FNV36_25890 [Raoultella ornithinolytica]